jgi:Flp pilus assembly protein TadG
MRCQRIRRRLDRDRRGAVAVLSLFLMTACLALVVLAIDCGVLTLARSELQRSADAGALAGAWEAMEQADPEAEPFNSSVRTSINTEVAAYFGRHMVIGKALSARANSNNLESGDVVLGVWEPETKSFTASVDGSVNAVRVHANRISASNGEVPLFFARIFGMTTAPCRAEAIAYFAHGISGFRTPADESNLPILPIAIKETAWDELNSGSTDDDDWAWDPDDRAVTTGADGVYEALLYPLRNGAAGNFCTVNIGTLNNSTGHLRDQIKDGVSPSDMALHGGSLDLSITGTLPLAGNPGISSGIASALEAIVGQARIIPIYRQVVGTGSIAVYTIVGWGGVRVMSVQMSGGDKRVVVQPASVVSKGAIEGSDSSSFVYSPPRLVQ